MSRRTRSSSRIAAMIWKAGRSTELGTTALRRSIRPTRKVQQPPRQRSVTRIHLRSDGRRVDWRPQVWYARLILLNSRLQCFSATLSVEENRSCWQPFWRQQGRPKPGRGHRRQLFQSPHAAGKPSPIHWSTPRTALIIAPRRPWAQRLRRLCGRRQRLAGLRRSRRTSRRTERAARGGRGGRAAALDGNCANCYANGEVFF